MSELRVFEDQELTKEVDRVLYEGKKYFVQLPSSDFTVISSEINRTGLVGCIAWHPRNQIATMRFVNRVGLVRFFGKVFDVRSEKLLESLEGKRQFEYLLDDLKRLSREIAFDYVSPTVAQRHIDSDVKSNALTERFNYYRHLVLEMPKNSNLEALVEAIFRNAHSRHVPEYIEDYVWNAKRPTEKTFISFFRQTQHFRELPDDHPLAKAKIRGFTSPDGKRSFFPLKVSTLRNQLSIDTAENRFIKHVLKDIEKTCIDVMSMRASKVISDVCEKILLIVRGLLSRDFFMGIGELMYLPTSSPTLTSRHGYRDMFKHYLNCKQGAKYLFDDLQNQSRFIDLKDIAQLYEYWVFYSIVRSLLGEKVLVDSRNTVVKNGKFVQSVQVSHEGISVAYNKTYVRRIHGSYSVILRPDIVIEVETENGPLVFLLDAKYRSRESYAVSDEVDENSVIGRAVLTEDIHKMHCYVDAIEGAVCALAVYPGTEFIFYPRDRHSPIARKSADMTSMKGVGAIPLLPGETSNQNEFNSALAQMKKLAHQMVVLEC